MDIEFIGTGAAHDHTRGNVSILVNSKTKLLLDCGFMNAISLFKKTWDPNFLDAIYISHTHADHFFATIPFIAKMVSTGRNKKLHLIGQKDLKDYFKSMQEIGELGMDKHYKFEIDFIEIGNNVRLNELELSFAPTLHGDYSNYSIKINDHKKIFGYSGDGRMTEEYRTLFQDCEHIVQNTKNIEQFDPTHCNIEEFLNFASTLNNLQNVFLCHMHQNIDRNDVEKFLDTKPNYRFNIYLPEPEDKFQL